MELVTGGSLEGRLKRGTLAVPEAARIGRGVLAALRAAHAAGIQHRDVKPGNVLLRADGTPVLTDFGIAALEATPGLTATGMLIGSPEYMAPERIHGREGDPASDLWSLGIMLYLGLEGHNPLRRDTTIATIAAVAEANVPPPVASGALGPVLSALLVKDPGRRPTAEQLDWMLGEAEGDGSGRVRGCRRSTRGAAAASAAVAASAARPTSQGARPAGRRPRSTGPTIRTRRRAIRPACRPATRPASRSAPPQGTRPASRSATRPADTTPGTGPPARTGRRPRTTWRTPTTPASPRPSAGPRSSPTPSARSSPWAWPERSCT
ncbi:protein kinase [Catenulispora yoronensis]